ncbi:hypothetical protein [Kribbella deserti]|uniref:LPXTG cell wall anchor domain-containing protein n=1 Tax=Kribbella deserti TaxID=1926257 RepID=A0ABV6QMU7_9ACTN
MIAVLAPMGEIDPNTVKPGWVALLIIIALGGATFLLWRNMGKQMKKINFDLPRDERANAPVEPADPAQPADTADGSETATERKPD